MQRVSRRRLLGAAGLGTVGLGTAAGCLDRPASGDPESGNGSENGDDEPGSCPSYGDRVDRVVCYDGNPDEAASLEPSAETVAAGESIEFTLRNDADAVLETNFYNWRVDKDADGEWHRVAPTGHNDPLMALDPGESHTWTVTPDNEGVDDGEPVRALGGTEEITLPGVGGGTYAFRARGWFEGEYDEEILAFATTFELDAEPLSLSPSDAVEDTEWEDDVLVAESSRGDPDDEHYRLGAYELEVVDEPADDPERVIAEQVVRNSQLRDAIALALEHDASAVRLEEYDATHPIFGHDSDRVYEYEGTYYAVETYELEE